jgi:hypothetical protein
MQNLNFDDGYKEFTINNDPSRVIRFNPADFSIVERIKVAYDEIDKVTQLDEDIELKADGSPAEELVKAAEIVTGINNRIKEMIDYIFNSPVSDKVFGKQSPLSIVKGRPIWQEFLECLEPVIKAEIKKAQEESRKRIEKYTKQVYRK